MTTFKDFDNPCPVCGGVSYFIRTKACSCCVRVKAARKGVKEITTVSRTPDYYATKGWGKRITDRAYHSKMSKADYN